ncbi:MAG: hypothetical protein PUE08_02420 [Eubacteriales bacterium]|nr:hypothetical protein [Eubacteriales bacterium]
MNRNGVKISKLLSLPVGGDLESVFVFAVNEASSEGASMCAITSILLFACDAKAFTGNNKAIRSTGINTKLKYLFSLIFFISDKKNYKASTD